MWTGATTGSARPVLGQAVAAVGVAFDTGFARLNYEILGNAYHQLHAHIWPRYAWESPERRQRPVRHYDDLTDEAYRLGPQHAPLRAALTRALAEPGGHDSDGDDDLADRLP